MIPRIDPETRPSAVAVQVIRRRRTDPYGNEKGRTDLCSPRPIVTRNGVPFKPYVWRRNDPERHEKIAQERAEREEWVQKTSEKAAALG